MSLNLPPIVWKQLIGSPITDLDVAAIDSLFLSQVKSLENQWDDGKEDSTVRYSFSSKMRGQFFVVQACDGTDCELVPGGKREQLKWENRKKFLRYLRKFRYSEFEVQISNIRQGLFAVVPGQYLSLFTWQELSVQVAGRGMSAKDVDLLQKMTRYSGGHSKNDPHIQMMWKMLRTRFNDEQRGMFLNFVWGRSRLPLAESEFEQKFVIQSHDESTGDPDNWLPIAHTCSFGIELPKYTNYDAMCEKIIKAMNYCHSIDADGTMRTGTAVVDDEEEEALIEE
eukprot:jgi/Bigna1/53877/estExt_Genewise1Plus.C_250106